MGDSIVFKKGKGIVAKAKAAKAKPKSTSKSAAKKVKPNVVPDEDMNVVTAAASDVDTKGKMHSREKCWLDDVWSAFDSAMHAEGAKELSDDQTTEVMSLFVSLALEFA
jgi:hypothetical protein